MSPSFRRLLNVRCPVHLLTIQIPRLCKFSKRAHSSKRFHKLFLLVIRDLDVDEKGPNDLEIRGRSPNYGKKDVQFRSFPTNSTWSSNVSQAVSTFSRREEESWLRSLPRKLWNFLFHRDDSQSIDDVVPFYRWLPILSGVTIPFSILLQIPGCTERWFVCLLPSFLIRGVFKLKFFKCRYVRTLDNLTIQSRPNPPILLAANIVAMVAALIANICLITRFLEKKVKRMTIISLCLLSVHGKKRAFLISFFSQLPTKTDVCIS